MILPLVILAIGAVGAGYLFKDLFIGHDVSYEFWGSSIKFLEPLSRNHPPTWFMFLTPILVIISIPFSFYLFVKNKNFVEKIVKSNQPLYLFLKNKWYFDELYDFIFVKPLKKTGHFFWKRIDENIIDRFGPDGISKLVKIISNKAGRLQTGFIYDYAFVMLLGLSILLTYLILK